MFSNINCALFWTSECICIHLKSDMEKFYLLCLMTRKLFTFAKEECMEENPDSIMCQEVLTPGQLYLMFMKVWSQRHLIEHWVMTVNQRKTLGLTPTIFPTGENVCLVDICEAVL